MENEAQLGWLIDHIYRSRQKPEELVDIGEIDGEGPVEGLRLELGDIWLGV
jgi:hypothetical protein